MSRAAIAGAPPTAMLSFHPWEFDMAQQRLALGRLSRFRTCHGIAASRRRLDRLMSEGRSFVRAVDVAKDLHAAADSLPRFRVGNDADGELS